MNRKRLRTIEAQMKRIVCKICNKRFLSKSALTSHVKFIHQHANIYKCPIENCKKFFNNQYRLDIHLMIHQGIKPYECDLCGKCFTEQGTLRSHLVTHSKLKPFKCDLCTYKCKTNPQLKNHYKKHHNDIYYYKCEKCYLKFSKKAELKHHLNEHHIWSLTQEREYLTSPETPEQGTELDLLTGQSDKLMIINEINFGIFVEN